jgi:molybdopterin-guanine dinucleotide biosynthesis protein A
VTLPAVGIFVGGQGRRMGGVAKGWLRHEGRPLIERLLDVSRAAAAPAKLPAVYLIGNAAAYAATHVPALPDDPPGVGPMGGLRALLLEAERIGGDAVALAVDLPFVNAALLRRLYLEQPNAAALAPRQADRWQPLFARYRPSAVLPVIDAALAAGRTSLQVLFGGLTARDQVASELVLSSIEQHALQDWDRPSDMDGSVPDRER